MVTVLTLDSKGKPNASYGSFNNKLAAEIIEFQKIKDKKEKEKEEERLKKKLSREFNVVKDNIHTFWAELDDIQ